jgi:hypothetical protein
MSDERGAPIVHIHKSCGHPMHPTTHCSECGEAITAKNIKLEIAKKWQGDLNEFLPIKKPLLK